MREHEPMASFDYYAVDQHPLESKAEFGNDVGKIDNDKVAVQIHRWVEAPIDQLKRREHVIGDWLVAERLLVRRGDPIGKRLESKAANAKDDRDKNAFAIHIEFPEWSKYMNAFHIQGKAHEVRGKKLWDTDGFAIEFPIGNRPPVLVDFEGGKRGQGSTAEDSAYEILVLDSDGKLIVRNSAADAGNDERLARYNHWRTRLIQGRSASGDGGERPAMPNMPKLPGGVPKGG